ncbi:site-specific integrase [Pseudoxanthomonas winnipegensis]|uniref:site-specific integrase n=1 Tax=Pseudoxanthomonas winnipegensis TaxID=2480810 RepID=UPI0030F3FEC5
MTTSKSNPPTQGETLHFKSIKIDKIEFSDVSAYGRQSVNDLGDLIFQSWESIRQSKRRRQSRYPQALPLATPSRLLTVEVADFLKDMQRRRLQPNTVTSAARSLKILIMSCGNVPAAKVTPQDIHQFWDLLRWAPPDLLSNVIYQSMSAAQIISHGTALNVRCPAQATFALHQRWLTSFFNALERTKAIPHSPMAGFKPPKPSLITQNAQSRLLSLADLQKIFDDRTFVPWARELPHRWWAPILGLYTGARIGEIAQLKITDVLCDQGKWCIAIRMTPDDDLKSSAQPTRQRLKGKNAIRTIPLHDQVIEAGFLDFLQDMKAFGHARLFPHLSSGRNRKTGQSNARYSQGLLNQFSDYLKSLGFPKGVGFHGFRHTLATELHAAGVTPQDIALVTGHSLAKSAPVLQTHYIHQATTHVLARQIATIDQFKPGVVLSRYVKGQFASKLRKDAKVYP